MIDLKRRLRDIETVVPSDLWADIGRRDPSGTYDAPAARSSRLPVFAVSFAVLALVALLLASLLPLGSGKAPGGKRSLSPSTSSSDISSTVLWPERTQAALGAAQASADAGDPSVAWRTDPAKVAAKFAEDILGWGPSSGRYQVTIVDGSSPGRAEAQLTPDAIPCPTPPVSPPAGATLHPCPPPYEGETISLRQQATIGHTGVWSVTEVRATENLTVEAQPGQQIGAISGGVTIPSTAKGIPGFSAALGVHVGSDAGCQTVQGNTATDSANMMFVPVVPPDAVAGTDCGPAPGGYVWMATAPISLSRGGSTVADPLNYSGDQQIPTFYGLTLVPVQVLLPENGSASTSPTAVSAVRPEVLTSTVLIDPVTGTRFDPPLSSTKPVLTAQEAIARFQTVDHAFHLPSDATVQLGLYTAPRGGDGTYRFDHRLAYGIRYHFCNPPQGEHPEPSPSGPCIFWLFLDANTGKMLEAESQIG